jgi:hypothetical protein
MGRTEKGRKSDGKGDRRKREKGTDLFFHFSFAGVEKINLPHFFCPTFFAFCALFRSSFLKKLYAAPLLSII